MTTFDRRDVLEAIQPLQLTVITVLYRSTEMLKQTLPTWVRSARGLAVDFIFIDHSPDDGCREVISRCLDERRYEYHWDSANPGFAAGSNQAVGKATGTHVLLLNPDVWLNDDSLANVMAAVAEYPGDPIAIGLAMGGRNYLGIDINPISLFVDRSAEAGRGPLGPSGGAAVFPTAIYRRLGGFYEHMFAWGEDADMAYRLYATGLRTRALDLKLTHAWGHSVAGDTRLAGFRAYLLARNRVLVAARTFSWPLMLLTLPIGLAAQAALAARRARQGLLKSFLRGVMRGVVEAPKARRTWRGDRFGIANLASYLRVGRA